jgi:hypothetical protein
MKQLNIIDGMIKKVKEDLQEFKNPRSYEDDKYYIKLSAKADYAEDILYMLENVRLKILGEL